MSYDVALPGESLLDRRISDVDERKIRSISNVSAQSDLTIAHLHIH